MTEAVSLSVGDKIKTVRMFRQMSQQELGRRTGLSQFVISFIETNRANPTDDQLSRIKGALSWPSDEAVEAAFALLSSEAVPVLEN